MYSVFLYAKSHVFTFHYVSIKTETVNTDDFKIVKFTFHYVSIKTQNYNHYTHSI